MMAEVALVAVVAVVAAVVGTVVAGLHIAALVPAHRRDCERGLGGPWGLMVHFSAVMPVVPSSTPKHVTGNVFIPLIPPFIPF